MYQFKHNMLLPNASAGLPRAVRNAAKEGSMSSRMAFGEYQEAGKHLLRQTWRPMLMAFILMLNMTLSVKLSIAADSPNLVGKWKGSRDVVVTHPRMVNQRMSAPVDLEITEVAEDGAAFKGTLTLERLGVPPNVIKLNGLIENGVLKAKLGQNARLELSPRGDAALAGKIIRGEYDTDPVDLKRVGSSPTK